MTPWLRFSGSLWTLVVLCALLKYTQAQCVNNCTEETEIMINTTTVSIKSDQNCTLSIGSNSSEKSLTGLTPGASYDISFSCFNCCKVITMNPEVVTNVSVGEVTTSSIYLTWTKPQGISSTYKVVWTDVPNLTYTNLTMINITGLTAGAQYNISVTAVASDGITEGESVTKSIYTKPEAVSNLTVINFTSSSVSLDWSEPDEGMSSTYVVQLIGGNQNQNLTVKDTNVTMFNLTPGVQYIFTVTAVAADDSTAGEAATISQYTKPNIVRNLIVTDVTTSSVSVSWTEPLGNSSFYTVQWTIGELNETDTNITVYGTNITISGLTAGVQYHFSVTAVAADNLTTGGAATVSSYTQPNIVRNLIVTNVTTSSVSMSWTEPLGNSSFYRVQWTNGELDKMNTNITVYGTNVTISGLTAGVQYNFSVTAVAADNLSIGEAETVSLYTKPEKVRDLTVTNVTTSSVSMSWTEPLGNSSFYTLHWTSGQLNETDTNITVYGTNATISGLTAGVQYKFSVTAVAADNITTGEAATVSLYTRPAKVENFTVSTTTSSISLSWSPPSQVFQYKVELNSAYPTYTMDPNVTFSNLTAGTKYTVSITALAKDNTTGQTCKIMAITKPSIVTNLQITSITTTSVSLNWTKPDGNADWYKIQWNTGNYIINTTSYTITKLNPGSQYNITVTAAAVHLSNEGEKKQTSTFTRPEMPINITATPGTESMNISWTPPRGNVDYYVVNITNSQCMDSIIKNTTQQNTAYFTSLCPGRLFVITVTSVAGSFSNMSAQTYFATIPTPPGPIIVSQKTNSSLHLSWKTPIGMEDAPNISYSVTYYPTTGDQNTTKVSVNSTDLSELQSGTCYNITVETVGPENLYSAPVHTSDYTLPNPVLNLRAYPYSTTSVKVEWSDPVGVKGSYTYLVRTSIANGEDVSSTIVSSNNITVQNLEPGLKYNISVRTIAAPQSESFAEETFSYTKPNAVTNLTVVYTNTTAVQLTWLRQSDYNPSYAYLVEAAAEGIVHSNNSTKNETYTFSQLVPGQQYKFTVVTVVANVMSAAESTWKYTIPNAVSPSAVGNTTSLIVSWTLAIGKVSSYSVYTYRDEELVKNHTDLSNTTSSQLVHGLKPGLRYCVVVVTTSGPEQNNGSVCNATFPNPPGSISVISQTVNSINFTWGRPENMDPNLYNFSVSGNDSFNNWTLLENLESGSPYTISVVTVGELGYMSTAVTTTNYTRPYAVTNLTQTEITTNTMTLVWEQPESKPHYTYDVQVVNGSSFSVSSKNITIPSLYSGSNYSCTVTTLTADGTPAEPTTVTCFTRPYSVTGLKAETLNTSTIRLDWSKPPQYKTTYRYLVKTSGCGYQNKTVAQETIEISQLTAGTNCTFYVTVMTADGIKGEETIISQYTKPETVEPSSVSSQGSNSSISVLWNKPLGNVEWYHVSIQNNNGTARSVELHPNSTSYLFDNLSAGRPYNIILTTVSGPFNASSNSITNATFPNPPGPIEILSKTTSSLDFKWEEAFLMTGASFSYTLAYIESQGNISTTATTNNTRHVFSSLSSGTSYNISVGTVGDLNYESARVFFYMVTTRPEAVQSLSGSPEETKILVTWDKPIEWKKSYRYNLFWLHVDNGYSNSTVLNDANTYTIDSLTPGSRYQINVTTETSDGTLGAPNWTSSCTNASPVPKLECHGPNTVMPQLVLNWTEPKGQFSGFQVNASNGETNISECCSYTVNTNQHYTDYQLTVETQSCGRPSTPVKVNCTTGITNPVFPSDPLLLLTVTEKTHTTFTVQIDSSLFINSNGPIQNVGVLVMNSDVVLPDSSDFGNYLGKTYNDWKAKNTPVYLATVMENTLTQRSQSHMTIQIGTGSTWGKYTNGPLEPNGKYRYVVVVFTLLVTEDGLVNIGKSLFSITNHSEEVSLPGDPAKVTIAVGATAGVFCVFLLVLIGFIIYWKRLANKQPSDIQIQSMRAKVSVAVRVEDYEAFYNKQKADSNCGFAEEFEDLKLVGTGQAKIHALSLENKPKNRYNNVLPYDSSRVKLSIIHGSPYDDYINANYMPGYNSRKEFIAAQGPLPATVNEFWRMIWEKNVQSLVMLTRCNEQGRVKCEQYWGPGTKHFEDITVTTSSEIPLDDWTIRDFDIKNVKTAETRSVRHFHFTAWPDHGVPETTELLISFRHLVREHMNQYSRHSPTVVHCSAGVGRTGTFIAIDRLLFQIERENIVDVYGIVHDLRMHRPLMVQTEDQYVFLNQCALDIIRSRTGTNVDLIYQNTAALSIYENVEPKKEYPKSGYNHP